MRHARIDAARTPADEFCVPLRVDSHATSACTALYTWVAACPHGAMRLCTYVCTNVQTAVPTQDLTGSHLCMSSCVDASAAMRTQGRRHTHATNSVLCCLHRLAVKSNSSLVLVRSSQAAQTDLSQHILNVCAVTCCEREKSCRKSILLPAGRG